MTRSNAPATLPSDSTRRQAIHDWFVGFGACVRRGDLVGGEAFFDRGVVAFGTKADVVAGLDNLVAQQWSGVWPNIADFAFRLDQLHVDGQGDLAWAVVPWTSTGFDESGSPFDRPGRATIVLRRHGDRWLAIHSHFSLNPGVQPRTYGSKRQN